MEKIKLKPVVKELIHKNSKNDSFFDIISYREPGIRENSLGSLFVLGNIKNSVDNELSYIINLAASIAKREYYSDHSISLGAPKEALEKTLKKTNEVLSDFFKGKNSNIDLAIISVAGQNIYVSRIGKLKIMLARDGETIDILNNVQLFNKELTESDKEFSNIISGKLHDGDKIFAYIPFRVVTSREGQIKEAFSSQNQNEFEQKIANLASSVPTFYCCGIHLVMTKIKEIPIDTAYISSPTQVRINSTKQDPESPEEKIPETSDLIITNGDKDSEELAEPPAKKDVSDKTVEPSSASIQEAPRIIPSEVSLAKKHNALSNAGMLISKFKDFNKYNTRTRASLLIIIAGTLFIGIFTFIFFGMDNLPFNEESQLISRLEEDVRLANVQITQNNTRSAREMLAGALNQLIKIENKRAESLIAEITQTISGINKVSPKKPELVADINLLSTEDIKILRAVAYGENERAIVTNQKVFTINESELREVGAINKEPKYIFGLDDSFAVFDGIEEMSVYDKTSSSLKKYKLLDPVMSTNYFVYADNLYSLSGKKIVKYTDAVNKNSSSSIWGEVTDELIAIAVDGNVYGLTKNGRLITYFKGEKQKEADLIITPSDNSRIWTEKDFAFVYILDVAGSQVMVFDKETGQLKTTYDLSSAGKIIDIFVSGGGKILTLSDDNKLWQITP